MCTVNWDLLLKYIEVLTRWQIVTFALVLIFIFKFRDPIARVLDRINLLKVAGLELGTNQSLAVESSDIDQTIYSKEEVEKLIEIKETAHNVLEEKNELYIKYQWEKATNLIFGTQIKLLEFLVSKGEQGASFVDASKFYFEHIRLGVFTDQTIERYLDFLKFYLFIEDSAGVGRTRSIKITPMGIKYADYLVNNYPNIKSLRNY